MSTEPIQTQLKNIQVEAIHPYETPCIMKFEVEANKAYADWIHNETK